jgi:hypothetical protein
MKTVLLYIWDHRIKALGLAQGTIAMLAGMAGVIPQSQLEYWLAASAVLTFWIGFAGKADPVLPLPQTQEKPK